MDFFLVVLFLLIYTLITFVIVYSSDTVDTANDDFEKLREPSMSDLPEEDRASYSKVEIYVKNTILPRYGYQILRDEIKHFQKDAENVSLCMVIINLFLSIALFSKLDVENFFALVIIGFVAMIIGYIYTSVVRLIYKKYSSLRIVEYYKYNPTYYWETHYRYLLTYSDKVIYRYTLRKIISVLTFLIICVLICISLS